MQSSIKDLTDLKKLLSQHIRKEQGTITINIANINHVSTSNDIVGNSLQEWLPSWFKSNGLNVIPNKNTQTFPDFIAHFPNQTVDMDIKCWNFSKSPAFDIANFDSFYATMYDNPDKIMAKYLVIGYLPNSTGFTIEYVEVKNLWDLMGTTSKSPLKIQIKHDHPYAIRPVSFYNNPKSSFGDIDSLLKAVVKMRKLYPQLTSKYTPDEWYTKVSTSLQKNGYI